MMQPTHAPKDFEAIQQMLSAGLSVCFSPSGRSLATNWDKVDYHDINPSMTENSIQADGVAALWAECLAAGWLA
jgi:hypothetical protein